MLLGWSRDPEKSDIFWETVTTVKEMRRNLIIVAAKQDSDTSVIPKGTINIWWDSSKNAQLMLLLAFMLPKNREWRDHPIRVIRPVVRKADIENIETEMQELLALARIEAELFIVPTDTPLHAVRQRMQPSALLLRGFDPPDDETDDETRQDLVSDLERTLELPGDIIFVYNAGEVSIEA